MSMCFHQPLVRLVKDESSCFGWSNFLGNVPGMLSASLFGLSNSSHLLCLLTWGKSPKAWWLWLSTEICVKRTFYCSGSKRGALLLGILSYEPSGLLVGHQIWSWGLWVWAPSGLPHKLSWSRSWICVNLNCISFLKPLLSHMVQPNGHRSGVLTERFKCSIN